MFSTGYLVLVVGVPAVLILGGFFWLRVGKAGALVWETIALGGVLFMALVLLAGGHGIGHRKKIRH